MKALPTLFSVLVAVAVLAGCGSGGSTTAQPTTEGGAGAMAGTDVDGGSAGPTASPEQGAKPDAGDNPSDPGLSPQRQQAKRDGSPESDARAAAGSKPHSQGAGSPPPRRESQPHHGRKSGRRSLDPVKKLLPGPKEKSQGDSTQGAASQGAGAEAESSSPTTPTEIVEQVVPGGGGSGGEAAAGKGGVEAMLEGLVEAGH
jgi:hypothetical protein